MHEAGGNGPGDALPEAEEAGGDIFAGSGLRSGVFFHVSAVGHHRVHIFQGLPDAEPPVLHLRHKRLERDGGHRGQPCEHAVHHCADPGGGSARGRGGGGVSE